MKKDYSILIGGAAGDGSRRAGLIIAKLLSEYGYRIFIYDDYQSLIRGGHNFSQIRASNKEVLSHQEKIDFLLALNEDTIEKHKNNLDKEGIIIYNSDKVSGVKKGIGVPIESITKKAGGKPVMMNMALVAGFAKIAGIELKVLNKVLKKEFKKFQELNLKIAERVYEETQNVLKIERLKKKKISKLLTGNEAVALGAVKAGLNFYFAYPMTPSTGILHYLAKHKKDFNIAVSHLENEIAIVQAALGAAFSGARTMVGTSGGGFALMTETFSMAAEAEIPLLIVESQRMSPSSGVPTYTGQGDLFFTLGAGHGDIVRFLVAPGDAEESFYWAGKLLNLSWKYQTPSILLLDMQISESTFELEKSSLDKVKYEEPLLWDKKENYLRYKDTKNGISPLAFPGNKGVVVKGTSYEHNEYGTTIEAPELVEKMQNKRLRKFKEMEKEVERLESVKVYGNKKSDKAIIVWGSTKGPAKEVVEDLGIKMIQPIVLQPFPEKQIKKALKGVKKIFLAETNGLGQLGKVLNCYGIKIDQKILKYNGRPFFPEEIKKILLRRI